VNIEAELKARLSDPAAVRRRLDALAPGEPERYRDRYFDIPGDRELRIRTVESAGGVRHLLTYKEPPVDTVSGSRPEYETLVADPATAATILDRLGHPEILAFTKDCVNYRIPYGSRTCLATLVSVPELDGSFLEVETMAAESELAAALVDLRNLLSTLGVTDGELTTQTYTGAVRAVRTGH
jgi:adenylate cyclase, class 2